MRKSAVVIGFGAFFLTMALMLKFYAYDKLAVIPKDINTSQSLTDPKAYFFDADTLKYRTAPMTTRLTVAVDKEESKRVGGNAIVLDKWQYSDNNGKPPPMDASTAHYAVDRHTGLPVRIPDENANGKPVQTQGYTIKFPFDLVKGRSYPYWDGTLGKAIGMKYVGTESIEGMQTYKYVVDIPPTVYTKFEVPGFLFGLGQDSPAQNADRAYANQRTVWADPQTGVFMKVEERQTQTVSIPGHDPVPLVRTATIMDDATVKANVDEYKTKAMQLKALKIAPWVLGILGVLLLIGGAALAVLLGRRPGSASGTGRMNGPDDEESATQPDDEFADRT
ncbi:DUF3068 domain-containing protein [Flexivirga meconopsidis]|uniref:DUF3068 domain-containing protein n=1 Tax=Flexivirga meconopsidis TaxID=2977121 RepID=UPI002240D5A4